MGNCHGCYGKENKRRLYKYKYPVNIDPSKKYHEKSSPDQSKSPSKPTINENRESQPSKSVTLEPNVPTKEFVDQILTFVSEPSNDESDSSDEYETVQNEGVYDYNDNETIHSVQNIQIIQNTHNYQQPQNQGNEQFLDVMMIKPNLFRPNTATDWDMSDMEDLQEDMAQELEALCLDHNQTSNSPISMDSMDSMPSQNALLFARNSSNLIQTFSHDWDSHDMEMQEEEMRKCLVHLNSLQIAHENSKSCIWTNL